MSMRKSHIEFETTMLPYMDALYGYAYYLAGEKEAANDLLQDTYLKAFRFFDKFEQGTNARAWLYRIMRNTYINDYRRLRRQPELVEYDEQLSSPYLLAPEKGDANDIREIIERQTLDDEVSTAISTLPEKFKSVVVLRDVEDLPYEEIAEALEIPVGTVRSRLHRARALLFNKLREYAKGRGYLVGDRLEPRDYAMAI